MTWFEQHPEISNSLMLIPHYDAEFDDTKYYEVREYPSMKFIGNASATRFGPMPYKHDSFTDEKFYSVIRDIMPFEGKENMWLERIIYGYLRGNSEFNIDRYLLYRIVDKVKTFKEIQIEFPSILIDNGNDKQ